MTKPLNSFSIVSEDLYKMSVNEVLSKLKSLLPASSSNCHPEKHEEDTLAIMQQAIFYIQDLNDILSEDEHSSDEETVTCKL